MTDTRQKQLKQGGVNFGSWFEGESTMVQKAQWQEPEVADGVASAGVCVDVGCLAHFSVFI